VVPHIIVSFMVVAVVVVIVAMTVGVVVMVAPIPPTGVAVVSMMAQPKARRAVIEWVVIPALGGVVLPVLVVRSYWSLAWMLTCAAAHYSVVYVCKCWRYPTVYYIVVYVLFRGARIDVLNKIWYNVLSTSSFEACIVLEGLVVWTSALTCRTLFDVTNVYGFTLVGFVVDSSGALF